MDNPRFVLMIAGLSGHAVRPVLGYNRIGERWVCTEVCRNDSQRLHQLQPR